MGVKNIIGELQVNGDIVATQKWVSENGNGSGAVGEKEIVVIDIMTMIATQDNTSFVDLSQRYINGEVAIIGNAIGKNIIVSNIECTGEEEYAWTAILSNWVMGENQDLSHADIAVFGIENKNGVLSLGSRTIPVSEILTIDEMRNLPDYFTLTDEEMAKWREMIGAVKKTTDQSTMNRVYGEKHSGGGQGMFTLASGGTGDMTIPMRNANGQFDVREPKSDLNVANKEYVDNLPDKLTLTDDEKAKWRGMIGSTKLWKHTIKIDGHNDIIAFTASGTPYTMDNISSIGSDYIFAKYGTNVASNLHADSDRIFLEYVSVMGVQELQINLADYQFTDTVTEI